MNNRFDCSSCFAGITGGLGMPIVIAGVLIVIGCVIMKRRHPSKRSSECSKLVTTVMFHAWSVQCGIVI